VAGSSAAKGSPALPEREKDEQEARLQVLETEDRFERFTETPPRRAFAGPAVFVPGFPHPPVSYRMRPDYDRRKETT